MESNIKKYIIEVTPFIHQGSLKESRIGKPYLLELETDRLEWSMEQYQRNREPLTWKVVKNG